MTLGSHQTSRRVSDTYITPQWLVTALGGAESFAIDPCAAEQQPWPCASRSLTVRDDGLRRPWPTGPCYLNPPFSQAGIWIEALARHGAGIALLHARCETKWFRTCWQHASAILFMSRRIRFCTEDGVELTANSGAPPVLIAFGPVDRARLRDCNIEGVLVESWKIQE